jgi:hypothetical protein
MSGFGLPTLYHGLGPGFGWQYWTTSRVEIASKRFRTAIKLSFGLGDGTPLVVTVREPFSSVVSLRVRASVEPENEARLTMAQPNATSATLQYPVEIGAET